MQLALGDYARYLCEEDFHIDDSDVRCSSIVVDIRITPRGSRSERAVAFTVEWIIEFGDIIQQEANGNQYIALRTKAAHDSVRGTYRIERFTLEKWPETKDWLTAKVKERKLRRLDSIFFYSIDPQRDIHTDLRDRSSFVSKLFSSVNYEDEDISEIEERIRTVNEEAVNKSVELTGLKAHLDGLNSCFQGTGTTEITPFPKRIRDLCKHVSIHFGDNVSNSFPMEYHGMGTRSWASLLAGRSFVEMTAQKHAAESKPFFSVYAVEEPEAHLHPNAQKTLYRQLAETNGQVVISTHSPYLASVSNCYEILSLRKMDTHVRLGRISPLDPEDQRRLYREILHSRGEILFATAIILCEGETEEQCLPILFAKYFKNEAYNLGVNFVGAGGSGKRYLPFFTLARDFCIPVFVFSDGETAAKKGLQSCYESVFGSVDISNCANITLLENADFEGYLLSEGYSSVLEDAISEIDGKGYVNDWMSKKQGTKKKSTPTQDPPCVTCKQPIYTNETRDYTIPNGRNIAIQEILDKRKTTYAPIIAHKLAAPDTCNFPAKITEFFEKVKAGASI
jgi:putative ATP-dependent endonuclease of OLD family